MPFSLFESYLSGIAKHDDYQLFEFALSYTDLSTKSNPIDFDILAEIFFKNHRDYRIPNRLIELEANIANITDGSGYSLASWAAAYGLKEVVIMLVEEAGCDPLHNTDGETPLSLAVRNNRLDLIKYFVESLKIDVDYTPNPITKKRAKSIFWFSNSIPDSKPLSPLATAVHYGKKNQCNYCLS